MLGWSAELPDQLFESLFCNIYLIFSYVQIFAFAADYPSRLAREDEEEAAAQQEDAVFDDLPSFLVRIMMHLLLVLTFQTICVL